MCSIQPISVCRIVLALCGLVVSGCAAIPPRLSAQPQSSVELASDTALFATLVREIYSGPEDYLRVDPRPLQTDPTVMVARSQNLAEVPPSVVQSRSEVLRRIGVPEVDAVNMPSCAGALVPLEFRPPGQTCPSKPILVAILGLPRPGGAYAPGYVDEREEGAKQGYWSIRVIERSMDPKGSSTTISDYVVQLDDEKGWKLVKKHGLLAVD